MKHNIDNIITKAIKIIYICLMLIILIACLMSNCISYYTKRILPLHNAIYLLIGFAILLCIGLLARLPLFSKIKNTRLDIIMIIALNSILSFSLIFITHCYYFKTGWDAGMLISEANKMALGQFSTMNNHYFSACQNNIPTAVLLSLIIRLSSFLQIENYYFSLIAFQCLMWGGVGTLLYCSVRNMLDKRIAILSWFIFVLILGFSPWVTIPYTDTMALFFASVLLYLFSTKKNALLFGIVATLGFFIKPQVLILPIALFIVYVLPHPNIIKQNMKTMVLATIGIIMGLSLSLLLNQCSHVVKDNNLKIGISHYFMLGLNEESNGVFSESDSIYSNSFPTYSERCQANIDVSLHRIVTMGPVGLVKHYTRKLLNLYDDGTFAWGIEGEFFKERIYRTDSVLNSFFQNVYYSDGSMFTFYRGYSQAIWLAILLFTAICVYYIRENKQLLVLSLTIIGVTLFDLLFEVRSRHLLIYLPIYITIAAYGTYSLTSRITKLLTLRSKSVA